MPDLFTKKQLEKILDTWKTKAKVAQLKKDPKAFFEKIKMKVSHKTTSFSPFVAKAMTAGIREWSEKDFIRYTKIASTILRNSGANIDSLRSTFTAFKNEFRKHHSEDSARFHSLKQSLSSTPEEAQEFKRTQSDKVKAKNKHQVILMDEDVEKFIKHVIYKDKPDLIDKLLAAQVVSGGRSIEIISSKVSEYKETKDPDEIIQIGVAKTKGKERSITKPILFITSKGFMKLIGEIRTSIGDISKDSNEVLGRRYNGRINERVRKYMKEVGLEVNKELKSSHGLRRLWVNFAYKLRSNRGQSLASFISENLGHDPSSISSAAQNYSSIAIDSASILTDNQAQQVNTAQRMATENKQEIQELKEEIKEIDEIKSLQEPTKSMPVEETKFKKIEKLIKAGKTSYVQMNNEGITNYTYSAYKKAHGLSGEPVARAKPKVNIGLIASRLKRSKKALTYQNFRQYGFTNAEIKSYLSK